MTQPLISSNPQHFTIIHQDDNFLVVNKPSDLLTVPGRGPDNQECLINRLLLEFPNARIVHRLDYATSGLVIIPLNYEAQKNIGKQFELRQTQKQYIAVVDGIIKEESGQVDLPLICDWPNRPKQMVDHVNGKSAQTDFTVLGRDFDKSCTRLMLKPITGRSHQLRVHMMAINHAILGDRFYATGRALDASERLLLHAESISFIHPVSGETVQVSTPAPF